MAKGVIFDAAQLQLDPDWRIASATSARDGRQRWTTINVYMLPDSETERLGTKRRYVAEVLAESAMPGERTKSRRVATGTLDRALDWIDDSDLGAAVKVQAREFAIESEADAGEKARREAERTINEVLWPIDSPTDRAMMLDLVDEMGLSAFTDAAVIRLAARQRERDATRGE